MYMTHQFAHRETLERACNWLSKLGFDPSRMEIHDEGCLGSRSGERWGRVWPSSRS